MSNNKQSSVQQFWDKIALKLSVDQITEFLPLLEQALEMENQQRLDAINSQCYSAPGPSHTLGRTILQQNL